jgi:hypothetical protein
MIAGPAGPLQALVAVPAGFSGARAAVVCHPHPLHGGSMDNKVVHTVARTFEEMGLATVRFNFRGVGASGGTYDDGRGETDDAAAICDWARAQWHPLELWLAGFSFGALVAARLATRERATPRAIARLATIAPPVERLDAGERIEPGCPWLIVQGDQDDLVNVDGVRAWIAQSGASPHLVVIPGVDHFFHGRLHELKAALQAELAGSRQES